MNKRLIISLLFLISVLNVQASESENPTPTEVVLNALRNHANCRLLSKLIDSKSQESIIIGESLNGVDFTGIFVFAVKGDGQERVVDIQTNVTFAIYDKSTFNKVLAVLSAGDKYTKCTKKGQFIKGLRRNDDFFLVVHDCSTKIPFTDWDELIK